MSEVTSDTAVPTFDVEPGPVEDDYRTQTWDAEDGYRGVGKEHNVGRQHLEDYEREQFDSMSRSYMHWAIGGIFTCTFPFTSPFVWYRSSKLMTKYRQAGLEYSASLNIAYWVSFVLTVIVVAALLVGFALLVGKFGVGGALGIIGGSIFLIALLGVMLIAGPQS